MAHHRIIGASYAEDIATRDNRRMRMLVESEWYQTRWPISFKGDQNAKTYFENDKTGWRQSCAVKSMTGKRGDRVLWDDPHSVEGAISEADRTTALRVFAETLPSRLNSPELSAIIVVMQRLHEKDVSGHILANEFGYEKLILPMEFEPSRRCETSIGFIDPRTDDGELLFPERFPAHVVARDKIVMGSNAVAGQFQQRPSPRGGGMIKGAWFGRYSALPKMQWRQMFGDTAQKTGENNDYSVFELWGMGYDNRIYLIDLVRGKWESPELKRTLIDFWSKHTALTSPDTGELRSVGVEDKVSGTSLIQEVRRDGRIPIYGIQRNKDKLQRVNDYTPQIEAGYVMIPSESPFVSDFVAECEAFTANDSHAYDDQIDPMLDAIETMRCQGFADIIPPSLHGQTETHRSYDGGLT